eukprot:TRINITY_DN37534_c0_g1_i2.p3 TRINITY_DN37534_c0_g1~~TRINITY_DN37534_c0_g1_i2.p3  ORF type:complete len:155 (-),score=13.62 TRINITY_DN37534_c0_g1_i2:836-1300(-)
MDEFSISRNTLTGTLPSTFSAWGRVTQIYAQSNAFSGTFPPEYSVMTLMDEFSISQNRLTGTLPSALTTWKKVTEFYVYSNAFSGVLPAEYSTMTQMEKFEANDNIFTDDIPPQWSVWENCLFYLDYKCTLPSEYSIMTMVLELKDMIEEQISP